METRAKALWTPAPVAASLPRMSPLPLPPGACDCHTHVFGEGWPLAPDRTYSPEVRTTAQLLATQDSLGLTRVVLVQPSPYGTDNDGMAAALREIGPDRARGVAVIDHATSEATLRDLHGAGVRGVRINLHTAGRSDPGPARDLLEWTAARVAPLGWHVQVYTDLAVIAALHDTMLGLPTGVVVDHFGRAEGARGIAQPGFDALLSLLRQGVAHVKLSAAHRLSAAPDLADMEPIARALIAANPDRIVWASDWPHSGRKGDLPPEAVHPFSPIDDKAAITRLRRWAGDESMLARILVTNPARLYGFPAVG